MMSDLHYIRDFLLHRELLDTLVHDWASPELHGLEVIPLSGAGL